MPQLNDPLLGEQWNLKKIEAFEAWDDFPPARGDGAVVAVIDSGCDLDHPDLVGRFVTGTTMGAAGGDGRAVKIPGWAFPIRVMGTYVSRPWEMAHGTIVAGVIAATANNSIGIAGVVPHARIMPIALDRWGSGEVAAAIRYAADRGASVINMSIGRYGPRDWLEQCSDPQWLAAYDLEWDFEEISSAIEYAYGHGCVLCAAAGNDNRQEVFFPGQHPLVIACGASDRRDHRWTQQSPYPGDPHIWGSNYGPALDVTAPGADIATTDIHGRDDGYSMIPPPQNPLDPTADGDYLKTNSGTTFAAAHVSGLAAAIQALAFDRRESGLPPDDVRAIIEWTAERVSDGYRWTQEPGYPNGTRNPEMGYGRVNMRAALKEAEKALR